MRKVRTAHEADYRRMKGNETNICKRGEIPQTDVSKDNRRCLAVKQRYVLSPLPPDMIYGLIWF